jgi:hypothetical protein
LKARFAEDKWEIGVTLFWMMTMNPYQSDGQGDVIMLCTYVEKSSIQKHKKAYLKVRNM